MKHSRPFASFLTLCLLVIGFALTITAVYTDHRLFPLAREPRPAPHLADALHYRLYTRVTPVTWPQLKPYVRTGDLYWGKVADIPVENRAFLFSNYAALTTRFTLAEAANYAAVSLDGEYADYAQALEEAKKIRTYLTALNAQLEPSKQLRFVAFYHLNIIAAYPEIVTYPDVVLIGKTNWTASDLVFNAQDYVSLISQAKTTPGILLGAITKSRTADPRLKTADVLLATLKTCLLPPPAGLGLHVIGFYYDADQVEPLLSLLSATRSTP